MSNQMDIRDHDRNTYVVNNEKSIDLDIRISVVYNTRIPVLYTHAFLS